VSNWRAFTGNSQNDSGEVGSWLAELDRWARADCGALDVVLSAHAGWNGERTRGASALEDWADSIVTLTRGTDDEESRYFKAEGRDVLVDEDRLDFDGTTRTLTLTGAGSRKAATAKRNVEALVGPVVGVVRAEPGLSTNRIEAALRDAGVTFANADVGPAAKQAVKYEQLVVEQRGTGNYYRPAPLPGSTSPTFPHLPETSPPGNLTSPTSPKGGGGGNGERGSKNQATSPNSAPHRSLSEVRPARLVAGRQRPSQPTRLRRLQGHPYRKERSLSGYVAPAVPPRERNPRRRLPCMTRWKA
jgi:hypothetical protein